MLSEVLQMNSSISSVNYLFTLVQGSPKWPRNSENLQIFPLASCACSASFMPQRCFAFDLSLFTNTSEEQNKNCQLLIFYTCWLCSGHQRHTVRQQQCSQLCCFVHDIKDTLSDNNGAHSCAALFTTSKPHCQTTNSSAHSCVALFMTSKPHCQCSQLYFCNFQLLIVNKPDHTSTAKLL